MKTIITCEKPSVARDYAKVLHVSGNRDGYIENEQYIITWCVGHLVTLAYPQQYDPKFEKWDMEDLPFLPQQYRYQIIKDVKKQFQTVKELYHRDDVGEILYAGDAGREGIYIQMLVRQEAGVRSGIREKVVWIDSYTDAEIRRGIREAKPVDAYTQMTQAGYMRAIEDYAFGINFTRALTIKYGNQFSSKSENHNRVIRCGRVMSCVLAMIVERENSIRNFVPTSFYRVKTTLSGNGISGLWKVTDDSAYKDSPLLYESKGFLNLADAQAMIDRLPKEVRIESVTKKQEKQNAPYLFNLAELQAECAKIFKIGPDKTLEIAQSLYEKKLTTYPRTDARVLSTAVAQEIESNLNGIAADGNAASYVSEILSNGWYNNLVKSRYVDDSKITDHYAIIPTGEISNLSGLKYDEEAVYRLITMRFLSIFYPPAVYEKITVDMSAGHEHFFTGAKNLVEKGYLELTMEGKNKQQTENITVKEGECYPAAYEVEKGETTPPKRYTSGSIILAMENAGSLIEEEELRAQIKNCGIGTSATRGDIIKKLISLEYICVNKKTQVLTPGKDGEIIYDIMKEDLPDFLTPKMTASWEKGLSQIEEGQMSREKYTDVLNDYIRKKISAIKDKNGGKNYGSEVLETSLICPVCHAPVVKDRFGYKCRNNRGKDEGCSFYIGQILGVSLKESDVSDLITKGKTRCIKGFLSKKGSKFDAALVLTVDNGKADLSFDMDSGKPGVMCPKCGGRIREGAKGFFCEHYKEGCKLEGLWKRPCFISEDLTFEDVKALLDGKQIKKKAKAKSGKSYQKTLSYDIQEGCVKAL